MRLRDPIVVNGAPAAWCPDFSEAITRGEILTDAEGPRSMFHGTCGYIAHMTSRFLRPLWRQRQPKIPPPMWTAEIQRVALARELVEATTGGICSSTRAHQAIDV
jgi:hypothetical protein